MRTSQPAGRVQVLAELPHPDRIRAIFARESSLAARSRVVKIEGCEFAAPRIAQYCVEAAIKGVEFAFHALIPWPTSMIGY